MPRMPSPASAARLAPSSPPPPRAKASAGIGAGSTDPGRSPPVSPEAWERVRGHPLPVDGLSLLHVTDQTSVVIGGDGWVVAVAVRMTALTERGRSRRRSGQAMLFVMT